MSAIPRCEVPERAGIFFDLPDSGHGDAVVPYDGKERV